MVETSSTRDGLRRVELIGRKRESRLLDGVYQSICAEKRTAVIWLHGEAGCGKSALVDTFVDKVQPQPEVLRGNFAAGASPDRKLGRMLARFFDCPETNWEAAFRCVHQRYAELGFDEFEARYDVIVLAEIIAAGAGDTPVPARCGFESPRLKYLALSRLFRRLAASRPVVLWLDDVDASIEALGLVRHLLSEEDLDVPLLVLATSRADGANEGESRRERIISQIVRHRYTTRVEIGRLPPEDHLELIEHLAPLEATFKQRLARHTRGHPLFTVQLVTDWLERDLLEPSDGDENRLTLVDEAHGLFPDQLQEVWWRRLERALSELDVDRSAAMGPLEVAAALGASLYGNEWRRACREAGVELPGRLVAELARRDLVEPTADGWRFAHRMLQQSIARRMREEGRWIACNRACARALRELYGDRRAGRVAGHLIEAQRFEEAVEPLHLASHRAYNSGRYEIAAWCLDRRDELLDDLGVGREDRRRVQGLTRRAHIALSTGEPDKAKRLADKVLELAEKHRWEREEGWASLVLGRHANGQGRVGRAADFLERALSIFERVGDREGEANARASLGYVRFARGQHDSARQLYREASREFSKTGDLIMQARLAEMFARISLLEREWEQTVDEIEHALDLAQKAGDPVTEAACWLDFGEVERGRGRLAEARTAYGKAASLFKLIRNRNERLAYLNGAMVDIADGDCAPARERLERLVADLPRVGLKLYMGMAFLGLACCALADQQWREFDEHLESALDNLSDHAFADESWLAERAAHRLLESGHRKRALRAFELAAERYRKLSRDADADRIEARIEKLEEER